MPDTSEDRQNQGVATKIRGVRVDDELWQRAQAKAAGRREAVADVIRRALLAYVEEDEGQSFDGTLDETAIYTTTPLLNLSTTEGESHGNR